MTFSKRILVLSDSHGASLSSLLMRAESMGAFNAVIHLGDGFYDLDPYTAELPTIYQVGGNCDFMRGEKEILIPDFGPMILATHGHCYAVKSGLSALEYHAREVGAKAALFGHTHRPMQEDRGGLLLLNPGAAYDGHFAILCIDNHGEMLAQMY